MSEQKPQQYVYEYLRKGLEKSLIELEKVYGQGKIPNTPESTRKNERDC